MLTEVYTNPMKNRSKTTTTIVNLWKCDMSETVNQSLSRDFAL